MSDLSVWCLTIDHINHMISARVSDVEIVLFFRVSLVAVAAKSDQKHAKLNATHAYNPAGRAYRGARWRDGGL